VDRSSSSHAASNTPGDAATPFTATTRTLPVPAARCLHMPLSLLAGLSAIFLPTFARAAPHALRRYWRMPARRCAARVAIATTAVARHLLHAIWFSLKRIG